MELTYRAFGLTIASDLSLPGLPLAEGAPEVRIQRGKIPEWTGEATVRYGERAIIRGQEWAIRFNALPFAGLVRDGNLVHYEADPENDDGVRMHLLGSCTGALLFQRGFVPIHANTVVTTHGTALLAGRIGAGKSATTMALLRRGHRLLADDISALSFDSTEGAPVVLPGIPRLKLWKATLDHFQCDASELRRLRPQLEKYQVPVDELFCEVSQRLNAVYILQPRDEAGVRVRALSGLARLDAMRGQLYKIRFPDAVRNWPPLLGKLCQLADTVRVNILERPTEGNSLEAVAEAIENDLLKAG